MTWLVSRNKQGCEPAAERDSGGTRSEVDSNDLQRFPPRARINIILTCEHASLRRGN